MVTDELFACRYSGDNPEIFGIGLDSPRAASERLSIRSRLLADAVRLSGELIPSVQAALQLSAERLGLDRTIQGYVYNDPAAQAASIHVGGDDTAAIMLSSGLIRLMSSDELPFVIGHELGHMIFDHNLYPQPVDAPDEVTRLNWLALQRAGEISADRIGLIACGSADVAFRTILKIATGLGDEHLRFDLATFLDQLRHLKRIGGHASGITSSHPILTVRMKALMWFEMSNVAKQLQGSKAHSIAIATVDARVERMLEQATGEMLARVRAESFDKAAMWAVLFAAVSDGVLSKKEQIGMEALFGRAAADGALTFVRKNGPDKVIGQFEEAMKEVRFHPESGRREFFVRLQNYLKTVGLEDEQIARIVPIVGDRLGLTH